MGVEVSWDNPEQTLIRYDFTGQWTFKEFTDATQTAHAMINAAPHDGAVATILIISEKLYLPPRLFSFAQERARQKHPRTAVAVLVTQNALMATLLKTLFKIAPNLSLFYGQANTLQEGRKLAYERIEQQNKKSNKP